MEIELHRDEVLVVRTCRDSVRLTRDDDGKIGLLRMRKQPQRYWLPFDSKFDQLQLDLIVAAIRCAMAQLETFKSVSSIVENAYAKTCLNEDFGKKLGKYRRLLDKLENGTGKQEPNVTEEERAAAWRMTQASTHTDGEVNQ